MLIATMSCCRTSVSFTKSCPAGLPPQLRLDKMANIIEVTRAPYVHVAKIIENLKISAANVTKFNFKSIFKLGRVIQYFWASPICFSALQLICVHLPADLWLPHSSMAWCVLSHARMLRIQPRHLRGEGTNG